MNTINNFAPKPPLADVSFTFYTRTTADIRKPSRRKRTTSGPSVYVNGSHLVPEMHSNGPLVVPEIKEQN